MTRTQKAVYQAVPALFIFFSMLLLQMMKGVAGQQQHITFTLMVIFGLAAFVVASVIADKLHLDGDDREAELYIVYDKSVLNAHVIGFDKKEFIENLFVGLVNDWNEADEFVRENNKTFEKYAYIPMKQGERPEVTNGNDNKT